MIDIQHLQKNNNHDLIKVTLKGRLTAEEYSIFLPHFESEIRHFTDLLVLFDLTELDGWHAGSQWRKLSFNSNHRTSLTRIAIVGPLRRARWMEKACRPLSYLTLERFRSRDMNGAWSWIEDSLIEKLRTRSRDLGV